MKTSKREILRRLQSKNGETLLEVVLSIGLFAITMLMVASMFATAMRTSQRNVDSEQKLNQLLNAAAKGESIQGSVPEVVSFDLGDGQTLKQTIAVQETKLQGTGSIYQFILP